jgi:transposase
VKAARREWLDRRQPFMRVQPSRLVFIDETSVKTNMTPLRGRSLCGERLPADAPFGKWQTQTFIAGLRCDELIAPWVIEGAMDGPAFDTYVETQLAPHLWRGDTVILDNLNVHKSPRSAKTLATRGAWFLFLPKYSPDLNPIEMAFAKLKHWLRKAAARTYDDLWRAIGNVCDLFKPDECWNYLKQTGYVAH